MNNAGGRLSLAINQGIFDMNNDRYYMQVSNRNFTKTAIYSVYDTNSRGFYSAPPLAIAWSRNETTAGKILKMLNDEARAERACCCRCRCQS